MDIYQAIVLGIVQGVTEWLPVSSSGHLVLMQSMFQVAPPVFFDIMLHVGTLLAVTVYFRKDLYDILKPAVKGDFRGEGKMFLYIVIGTLASGVIAFFLRDHVDFMFNSTEVVGYALLITGGFLLATRFFSGRGELKMKHSVLIGLAQGIAVVPGISRSGATISAGMVSGVKREKAARFSFLLSIPAIIAATAIEWEAGVIGLESIVGTIVAFVVGYVSIDFLLKVIRKKGFYLFFLYCFALGIMVLVLL